MPCRSAAAALVVAALLSWGPPLFAQDGDSARARPKHALSVRPILRRYSVDTSTVAERAASVDYVLSAGRTRLRLTSATLQYTNGPSTINGLIAPALVAEVRTARFDTVRLTIRGPGVPHGLTSAHVAALGTAGTAVLDLESAVLGTTPAVGMRTAFGRSAGSLIVGFRFGLDVEPRPGGTDSVYWRGNTVHAGAGVTAFAGEFRITAGFDYARSFGNSLGMRNLFPGGGSYTARLDAAGLVGSAATLATVSAFYFRPLGASRSSQPNRRLPSADFTGIHGALLIPLGTVFFSPTVSAVRESTSGLELGGFFFPGGGGSVSVEGAGWSVSGSMALDIPIGPLSVTPEAGYVGGRLSSEVMTVTPTSTIRSGPFLEPLTGWWTALEFTVTF